MTQLQRFHVGPRLSEMAVFGGVVYLAGQIPETLEADITVQTREVLEAIDRLLIEANSDKTRLLRAEIYLSTMDDFAGMNAVWQEWVVPGHTPPRATVQAQLFDARCRVEMVITAAVKQ